MKTLIAKKYARAIVSRVDKQEFYENLCFLASAFNDTKFKTLIESNQITKEKKLEFISSFFEKINPKFQNFIKLLINNSRLDCIPQIAKELEREKSFQENVFLGVVYTAQVLEQAQIKSLEERLSSKFNVKIKLKNEASGNDKVKISLEELGYEISFSMQTLQKKMSEFILKII